MADSRAGVGRLDGARPMDAVSPLSVGDARELAALRERAYGPRPDLDPAGEERLRMLERRARPSAPPSTSGPPLSSEDGSTASTHGHPAPGSFDDLGSAAPVPAVRPAPDGPAAADPVTAATPPDAADAPQAPRRPLRRHPLVLTAGAVAAGAALIAAGYGLGRLPDPGDPRSDDAFLAAVPTDPGAAATLTAAAPFSSRTLDPATLVQYEPIGAATFWTASASDGTRCLLLTVPVDGTELSPQGGVLQASCTPGGLPPSLQWTAIVGYPSPPDLPLGSIVRVTLDGDRLRLATGRAS